MGNGNTPATRADLDLLRNELTARMDKFEVRMDTQEERLTELIRGIETSLLKAFYGYAETNNKRISMVEGAQAGVTDRLAILENRVLEIERRLNTPPAA